jgi:chromosome segregation ATPase
MPPRESSSGTGDGGSIDRLMSDRERERIEHDATVRSLSSTIGEITKSMVEIGRNIGALTSEMSQVNTSIGEVKAKTGVSAIAITEIESNLEAIKKSLDSIDKKISELSTEISTSVRECVVEIMKGKCDGMPDAVSKKLCETVVSILSGEKSVLPDALNNALGKCLKDKESELYKVLCEAVSKAVEVKDKKEEDEEEEEHDSAEAKKWSALDTLFKSRIGQMSVFLLAVCLVLIVASYTGYGIPEIITLIKSTLLGGK